MFTNIFYLISFFNFPYVIAFHFEFFQQQRLFEIALDLIMVTDIATEFITTRENNGAIATTVQEIALGYIKATFFFDMLACLPGLVTIESDPIYYYFKVFRYLQMPRLFDQVEALVKKAKAHYVV